MQVERVKYIIWAADMERAKRFYGDLFGARVVRSNEHVTELEIAGTTLGIHGGGEGKRTWTGMAFQVEDVIKGADELVAAGGCLVREINDTPEDPAHLAMCADPEGNEIMLTQQRDG